MLNTSILIDLDHEYEELEAKEKFNLLLKQENFKTFNIFFRSSNSE